MDQLSIKVLITFLIEGIQQKLAQQKIRLVI